MQYVAYDKGPKVLIVDDEPSMRSFLVQALEPVTSRVSEAGDAQRALEAIESGDFDVVVSDMYMPGASGMELLTMAKQSQWDVGFILITGRPEIDQIISALRLEVSDFLIKPFNLTDLNESLHRSYQRLLARRESQIYQDSLEASIQRRTRDLQSALHNVENNYQATLEALVASLDAREHETYAHSFRVRSYTLRLARQVGYPPALLPQLEQAALLHDIGKIAVRDSILLKPAKLSEEEWVEMKKHTIAGEVILNRVSFLRPATGIIRHHHERVDGKGYPDGLAGEDIPLGARIFAFADTMDAMTSDRPYRKAPGWEAALKEIQRCAGSQFDLKIAEAFFEISLENWKSIRREIEERQSSANGNSPEASSQLKPQES